MVELVSPFRGLKPAPGRAEDILAPPYDVMNTAEARALAAGKPHSFLHVSRPEIDLHESSDPHAPAAYAKARDNFLALQTSGVLIRDPAPCLYFYRLTQAGHSQTGLGATASVAAYLDGRIKKHELTRPAKEDDRVRHIQAVQAQTGPVFLIHKHCESIAGLQAELTATAPDIDAKAADGVRHQLWTIAEPSAIERVVAAYDALAMLYIADGHHRCAAAARVAQEQREACVQPRPADSFLAVIFPEDQTQILAYNRVVRDLNGLSRDAFLDLLAEAFTVQPQDSAVTPSDSGTFGLYLDRQWYRLSLKPDQRTRIAARGPAERLDASILQDLVIRPMLGIENPRTDERIDFVGGSRGITGLTSRVDSGEMRLALALHPTSARELMAVADAKSLMPPKSTWFEPKLADGMLCHLIG